ncbi:MAG TPA: bifunctional 3-(3-hydroxy-phenyl)propionate/3-hydroxycinnamic acid hydroxylase, partial [Blastococcus sp.]|nr:bifunctional 3-(3-hydroxy-phenyl)propionate/3-hydroxycinnamic acid hydroxylase [Blastococcus sp.]
VLVDGRRVRLDDVLGPAGGRLQADGGLLVVARDDGTTVTAEDPGGTLAAWLRAGRAAEVDVRPDGIVRAAR